MLLQKYFGDRDFWSTTLRLALPMAMQKLLVSSFGIVDTFMITRLGDTALAAVGVAAQWSFLMNVAFFGFCSGAQVFIAQYWGVRDMDNVHRTYGFAMIMMMLFSLLFMAAALFAPRFIIGIYTTDPLVIEEGAAYLRIAAFSYPAAALAQIAYSLLSSTEEVKLPTYVSAVSVVLNIIFNALFIFKMNMGVRGAALATTISSISGPILIYAISYARHNQLIAPLSKLTHWSSSFIKRYLMVSLPVLLNESLWALGTTGYNVLYGRLSTEFFAAVTIFRSIENMAYVFFVGLCHACAVVVGKQVGSGEIEGAKRDSTRYMALTPVFSIGVGLALILLRSPILDMMQVTGQVNRYAQGILLIYGLEYTMRNIPYMAIVGVFRAGGDTRTGLLYDIIGVWCISLPLTWICGMVLKLPLLWVYAIMLVAEDLIKDILCIKRLRSWKWIMPVTEVKPEIVLEEIS